MDFQAIFRVFAAHHPRRYMHPTIEDSDPVGWDADPACPEHLREERRDDGTFRPGILLYPPPYLAFTVQREYTLFSL